MPSPFDKAKFCRTTAWKDAEYVRLAVFKSWWDVQLGPTWRAYRFSENDPWLDPGRQAKVPPRRMTAARDEYAAARCVNCGHLRYAGEGPGDPCWFCQCMTHMLPGEPPMEAAWEALFQLGHHECGGWYRDPTDPPGEITCACGDTLIIA
jgi:hypothetical protein